MKIKSLVNYYFDLIKDNRDLQNSLTDYKSLVMQMYSQITAVSVNKDDLLESTMISSLTNTNLITKYMTQMSDNLLVKLLATLKNQFDSLECSQVIFYDYLKNIELCIEVTKFSRVKLFQLFNSLLYCYISGLLLDALVKKELFGTQREVRHYSLVKFLKKLDYIISDAIEMIKDESEDVKITTQYLLQSITTYIFTDMLKMFLVGIKEDSINIDGDRIIKYLSDNTIYNVNMSIRMSLYQECDESFLITLSVDRITLEIIKNIQSIVHQLDKIVQNISDTIDLSRICRFSILRITKDTSATIKDYSDEYYKSSIRYIISRFQLSIQRYISTDTSSYFNSIIVSPRREDIMFNYCLSILRSAFTSTEYSNIVAFNLDQLKPIFDIIYDLNSRIELLPSDTVLSYISRQSMYLYDTIRTKLVDLTDENNPDTIMLKQSITSTSPTVSDELLRAIFREFVTSLVTTGSLHNASNFINNYISDLSYIVSVKLNFIDELFSVISNTFTDTVFVSSMKCELSKTFSQKKRRLLNEISNISIYAESFDQLDAAIKNAFTSIISVVPNINSRGMCWNAFSKINPSTVTADVSLIPDIGTVMTKEAFFVSDYIDDQTIYIEGTNVMYMPSESFFLYFRELSKLAPNKIIMPMSKKGYVRNINTTSLKEIASNIDTRELRDNYMLVNYIANRGFVDISFRLATSTIIFDSFTENLLESLNNANEYKNTQIRGFSIIDTSKVEKVMYSASLKDLVTNAQDAITITSDINAVDDTLYMIVDISESINSVNDTTTSDLLSLGYDSSVCTCNVTNSGVLYSHIESTFCENTNRYKDPVSTYMQKFLPENSSAYICSILSTISSDASKVVETIRSILDLVLSGMLDNDTVISLATTITGRVPQDITDAYISLEESINEILLGIRTINQSVLNSIVTIVRTSPLAINSCISVLSTLYNANIIKEEELVQLASMLNINITSLTAEQIISAIQSKITNPSTTSQATSLVSRIVISSLNVAIEEKIIDGAKLTRLNCESNQNVFIKQPSNEYNNLINNIQLSIEKRNRVQNIVKQSIPVEDRLKDRASALNVTRITGKSRPTKQKSVAPVVIGKGLTESALKKINAFSNVFSKQRGFERGFARINASISATVTNIASFSQKSVDSLLGILSSNPVIRGLDSIESMLDSVESGIGKIVELPDYSLNQLAAISALYRKKFGKIASRVDKLLSLFNKKKKLEGTKKSPETPLKWEPRVELQPIRPEGVKVFGIIDSPKVLFPGLEDLQAYVDSMIYHNHLFLSIKPGLIRKVENAPFFVFKVGEIDKVKEVILKMMVELGFRKEELNAYWDNRDGWTFMLANNNIPTPSINNAAGVSFIDSFSKMLTEATRSWTILFNQTGNFFDIANRTLKEASEIGNTLASAADIAMPDFLSNMISSVPGVGGIANAIKAIANTLWTNTRNLLPGMAAGATFDSPKIISGTSSNLEYTCDIVLTCDLPIKEEIRNRIVMPLMLLMILSTPLSAWDYLTLCGIDLGNNKQSSPLSMMYMTPVYLKTTLRYGYKRYVKEDDIYKLSPTKVFEMDCLITSLNISDVVERNGLITSMKVSLTLSPVYNTIFGSTSDNTDNSMLNLRWFLKNYEEMYKTS
jgi:hypothetical protein